MTGVLLNRRDLDTKCHLQPRGEADRSSLSLRGNQPSRTLAGILASRTVRGHIPLKPFKLGHHQQTRTRSAREEHTPLPLNQALGTWDSRNPCPEGLTQF